MSKTKTEAPAAADQTTNRRGLDPELQAMAKLDRIMAELPDHATGRVLAWIIGRYAPGCKMAFAVERYEQPKPAPCPTSKGPDDAL